MRKKGTAAREKRRLAEFDPCCERCNGYVTMNDGSKDTFSVGDSFDIPPGHDGEVVGNNPVVYLDFIGAAEYAKGK